LVKVVHGRGRARRPEAYHALPCDLTKPKPPGRREVQTPTKPYQDPCSRCERHWQIRFGLPGLTRIRIWLGHHSRTLLPTLTSRGVKYTHDIRHSILSSHSGPLGLCGIPPASDQKEIVHPPTEPHNVADRHAVAKVHTVAGPKAWTPRPLRLWRTVLIL
jgi:hypothetical protein